MSNQINPTVKLHNPCPPCPDSLRWSTNQPSTPGFYFMRYLDASRSRWVTAVVEVKPPQPGELLRVHGAYPLIGMTMAETMTLHASAQWSDRPVTEPTGG